MGVLAVAGDLVEDVVVHVQEPVRPGSDAAAQITRRRGGSAANVAAFAAQAGCAVRFIGCVGDDLVGEALTTELSEAGVDVCVQERGRTGCIVVVVDESGERTMLPDRAAAAELTHVDAEWLDGVDLLHLPLYGFDSGSTPQALWRAAAAVREAGGRVCVDISSVRMVDVHGWEGVLRMIDALEPTWISANADEALALGLDDPEFLRRRPQLVVLARGGAQPTRILIGDTEPIVIPVPPVPGVVDTTGAGDAFAAGFLTAIYRGEGLEDAVASAHALAARSLRAPGAALA